MAPADGSSVQKSRLIYVRSRTVPQSAHLWWAVVDKLQAASVPIAMGQTDGRIALFQNAPILTSFVVPLDRDVLSIREVYYGTCCLMN